MLRPAATVAVAALAVVALAQTGPAPAETAAPAATTGSLFAGVELGNSDYHRFEAGGTLRLAETLRATASAGRANFDRPDGDLSSSTAGAVVAYDFGSFGIGAGLRHGEIDDISRTQAWLARGFFEKSDWSVTAEIEWRETGLAASEFVENLGPGLGVVSGTSRCDVRGLGYQAQLALDRPRWSAFALVKQVDYREFDCALTLDGPGNGPPLHARGRALGRRLAANTLDSVSGLGPRLLPREATLIDSSLALGVTMSPRAGGRWYAGVELYLDEQLLGRESFTTALALAGRRLGDTWSFETWVGHASATVEDTSFAGVRMTAQVR